MMIFFRELESIKIAENVKNSYAYAGYSKLSDNILITHVGIYGTNNIIDTTFLYVYNPDDNITHSYFINTPDKFHRGGHSIAQIDDGVLMMFGGICSLSENSKYVEKTTNDTWIFHLTYRYAP
jgi:hypothetical protein